MTNTYEQGREAYQAAQFAEAVSLLNDAVQSDGTNWDARLYLGMSQYKLDHVEAACKTFRFIKESCPAEDIRLKATKALEVLEEKLATGTMTGSVSAIIQRPSEETLREQYLASKASAEIERTKSAGVGKSVKRRSRVSVKLAIGLVSIAALYFVYSIYATTFSSQYNSWFLQPGHKRIPSLSLPTNATKEELTFTGPGGVQLSALHVNTGSKYVVMVNRNTTGSIADDAALVEALARAGVSVFIYDYPGFGTSAGKPDLDTSYGVGLLAHENLVGRLQYDRKNVIAMGISLGSPIAAEIARQRGAHSLVLINGFDSLSPIARAHNPLLFLYPDSSLPAGSFNSHEWSQSHTQPALLLSTGNDSMVPDGITKDFYAKATAPKVIGTMKSPSDFQPILDFIKR